MALLLVAVVRADHVDGALAALHEAGHRATVLPSMGGFLRQDNTTLLIGIEDGQLDDTIAIFRRTCPGGEVEVPISLRERLADWRASVVQHAGATIFIVELRDVIRT